MGTRLLFIAISLPTGTPARHRRVGAIGRILASPKAWLEAVLGQILTDVPERAEGGSKATAVAFRASAPQLTMLSDAERLLMTEWLDRVIKNL